MTKETDKNVLGPFFYLWFGLSILLNVSGIASIVDGFVHWANFFKDFLDIYRHVIREPLSWAVHLVWPSWWPKIPPWVFDYLVIDAAFFFGFNAMFIRYQGRSFFSAMSDNMKHFLVGLRFIAFGPFLILYFFIWGSDDEKVNSRDWLLYTAAVFATVIVLAFLNWQLQHIGS